MEFNKGNWNLNKYENWLEFNAHLIEDLISDELIIKQLNDGVPNQFAPFSSFNNIGNYIEFKTLNDYLNENFENGNKFIVFGSDGAGNPFCFDKNVNNQIILIDFEVERNIFVNDSFREFLDSILAYRNFVKNVQEMYGQNAFSDYLYNNEDIETLEKQLLKISEKSSLSEFWTKEIQQLIVNKNTCD